MSCHFWHISCNISTHFKTVRALVKNGGAHFPQTTVKFDVTWQDKTKKVSTVWHIHTYSTLIQNNCAKISRYESCLTLSDTNWHNVSRRDTRRGRGGGEMTGSESWQILEKKTCSAPFAALNLLRDLWAFESRHLHWTHTQASRHGSSFVLAWRAGVCATSSNTKLLIEKSITNRIRALNHNCSATNTKIHYCSSCIIWFSFVRVICVQIYTIYLFPSRPFQLILQEILIYLTVPSCISVLLNPLIFSLLTTSDCEKSSS